MLTSSRLLAVATAAVALAVAVPAHAAAPTVEFTTPVDEQRFTASTFTFQAAVRMPSGGTVRSSSVSWFSAENRPVPSATNHPTTANPVTIQLADRTFPWNGRYRVDVTATGRDGGPIDTTGDENSLAQADFVIDAPPAAPGGLSTAVTDDRKVRITWQPNTEPDMVGYEVQRQLGSAPWEQVTVTGAGTTTAIDSSPAQTGGTFRYRVVAFRASADAGKLNPSQPSSSHTARVPAPPPTTTTTTTTAAPGEEGERNGGGRSGSSTGSGGSSGSSSGGSTAGSPSGSSAGGTTPTTLPTSGKVDLSGFASLLEQSREKGQAPATLARGDEDGGYEEALPFSGRQRPKGGGDDGAGGNEVAILDEGVSGDGSDDVQSTAFLAGGLLATVLVMHLLWVRSEVHRAALLEAVAPEPPPARPRRRRPVSEA